ncbi:MAG: FHA domain-containing protein [Vicinamibacteria bacterium]
MIAVRVLKDGAVVRETVIAALPATIGRDASCDVVLFDPSVSRRHAVLQQEDAGVVLRDLDSRNGILVGAALRQDAPLGSVLHCRLGAVALELERLSPGDTGAFSLAELQRAERRGRIARPLGSLALGLAGFLLGTVAEPAFWSPYQKSRGLDLSGQALGFVVMLLLGAFGLLIVLKAAGRAVHMSDTLAACARVVWLWPAVIVLRAASYYALGVGAHAFVREALLPNAAAAFGIATLAAVRRPGTSRRFRLAWAVAILAVAAAFEVNEGLTARRAGTPAIDHAVMPPVGDWTGPSVSEDAFLEAFERESAEAAKDAARVAERQAAAPGAE